MTNGPFAGAVVAYAQAGWSCILPVPTAAKYPPPVGFTGADGRDTTPMDLVQWATTQADHSIALRMPDGVIGIDVDHYDKTSKTGDVVQKRGGDTLAEYEQRWGPLPATWISTARKLPSGIRFYRVPPGRYRTTLGDAIEIIQRHHRYAVVAPSPHTETGGIYVWVNPDRYPSADVPDPAGLPELPAAWVEGLREGATEAGPVAADHASGSALLGQLLADGRPACAEVYDAAHRGLADIEASSSGGRHDAAIARVHRLVQLGAAGHPGVGEALAALSAAWFRITAGEDREGEWDNMLLTSARKAVTVVGPRQVDRDPCTLGGGIEVQPAAPAPVEDKTSDEQQALFAAALAWSHARPTHVREVVGAAPFEPRGEHDQTLAKEVLDRTRPVLHYAFDAGAWLLWGPERWGTRPDLAEWSIAELARLMPRGDSSADKDTDGAKQAARRARFMAAGASSAIAKKMRALVAAGTHESSVELARLDAEPDILWAGGVPWDLRASTDWPVPAQFDPHTPHMRAALLAPDPTAETPLWDAFTTAVWPDPELRAWALRVLSIAFTGYSDKALPIMLGEKDRGKTQIVTLLMSVLENYAHAADPRLLGGADKTHASIVYALKGRRLSFIDEAPRDTYSGQERLKQLTGGGELTANEMNKNPITFRPTHTLVLTANDEPILTDPAVRSRVRLIPCKGDPAEVIRARAAIGHVSGPAWQREAPGVLAMMMREAALWLAEPDTAASAAAPEGVRYLAENIAADQDPIRAWVEAETEPSTEGTKSSTLYEAFVAWCRRSNVHPSRIPSTTKFGRVLTELGYPRTAKRDGQYRALRLTQHGGWAPLLPLAGPAVTGSPAPVTSGDMLVRQPVTAEKPSSDPVLDTSVTSVTSTHTTHTHTPAHTPAHTHTQGPDTDQPVILSHGPTKTGSDQEKEPKTVPVTGNANLPQRYETSELAKSLLSAREEYRERDRAAELATQGVKPTRTALKAAIREEEQRAAIVAAAGPRVPLPAVADRAGTLAPLTIEQVPAVLDAVLARSGALTVDVETTGYPVGHADYALRTVQLGDEHHAVVLDPADRLSQDVIRAYLAEAPILQAHSATADLVPLVHAGLVAMESAWDRMHDTVIRAKLGDPQSTGSDAAGLKELSGDVLGPNATTPAANEARKGLFKAGGWLTETKPDTPIARSGWAQVDSACSTMVRYAASDVLDTAALPKVLPAPEPALLARERTVQRLVARISHRGVRIDGEHVAQLRTEHGVGKEQAAERVRALGVANPGSDKELVTQLTALKVALPRTKPSKRFREGQPSVAAGVIDVYKDDDGHVGDLVRAVLDYRHHETALGLFLEPYHQLVSRGDGRARPTVYTLGADTGRMSCVRPNFQQLPREGGIRACITADPGQLLVSADFKGVEIRVAAALSGDQNLQRMIAEGVDLHWVIARQVWGPDATKAHRYAAKRIVFGRFYGGAVETLARQAGVRESLAAAAIDVLDATAPQLTAWSREIRNAIKQGRTHFPTYNGRVIHLPASKPHAGPNYAIQGTARELLMDGLIKWSETRWGTATLWPVHDEVDVAVPAEDAEEATAALVACMQTDLYGVPIVAEPSAPSFAWADSV